MVLAVALVPATALAATSRSEDPVFAQEGREPEAEGQDPDEEGRTEEGEGQDEPEAETGAGEGETEEAEEGGPPWTYQMARISIALTVLLALGMGYLYYRLVVVRRRGEI